MAESFAADGTLPLIALSSIRRIVGGGAFTRGEAYQRQRRVQSCHWDPKTGVLQALVRGSGLVYRTVAHLSRTEPGGAQVRDDSCSCPIGGDCKHVAALLLEFRQLALAQFDESLPGLAEVVPLARRPAAPQPPAAQPPTPAPPPSPWRQALLPVARAAVGDAYAADAGTPRRGVLGLQFRVDGLTQALQAPTGPGEPPLSLSVRPVKQGAGGKWVNGNDVPWEVGRYRSGGFDPAHEQLISSLGLLTTSYRYSYGAQWRRLDDFASEPLWLLLSAAARVGLPLVGTGPQEDVRLAGRAEVVLDLRVHSGAAQGLRLTPRLRFDDETADFRLAGPIGDGGLFAVQLDGRQRTIILGPVAKPLGAAGRAVLGIRETPIPQADVPEFLETALPGLRRGLVVISSDASVDLPEVARPVLVVGVEVVSARDLRVSWEWAYGDARRPLADTGERDPLRQPAEEATVLDSATGAVRTVPGFAWFRPQAEQTLAGTGGQAALGFVRDVLPLLRGLDGVRVEVSGELPDYRELDEAPVVSAAVTESGETDWFDLGVTISVEGREIPFGPLFSALASSQELLILDDGSYLRTDLPVFFRLRELIEEARRLSDRPGQLRLNRYQASLWGEFAELADVVEQADRWRDSVSGLLALDGAAPAPEGLPSGLSAELRGYQRHGYDWLRFLWRHDLGGVLADDMGLGKTLQVLAVLARAVEDGGSPKALVVAPASVTGNWASEAARFTPGLRVTVLSSTLARAGLSLEEVVAGADVVVTSYALFRIDFEELQPFGWDALVLDEAQFLKNARTKVAECARLLRARLKLAVTGTPVENNLMELWSVLAVVAPGLYSSATRFREEYVKPVDAAVRSRQELAPSSQANHRTGRQPGTSNRRVRLSDAQRADHERVVRLGERALDRLRRRLRPLLLRRTKEQVAPELPARIEQELVIELPAKHRRAYDTLLQRERQRVLGLLGDFETNRFEIFRALTQLRRAALDMALIDPERYADVPSGKVEVLFEQLEEITGAGHRALVFSQFTSFLARVGRVASERGLAHEYLDGGTIRRAQVIERFRTGTAPLFLISLKAGGFGLNLTEADYVFLLDPWWNPATENQAIDRAHRIGQTRPVMVFRLISDRTIEDKVMALKARKAQLFEAVLNDDDGAFSQTLSAADIRGLLEP